MKEIVIKLSDTEYNQLIYGDDGLDYEILEQATVNGTVLPKHGRLIDADAMVFREDGSLLYDIPTILESNMVEPQESEK